MELVLHRRHDSGGNYQSLSILKLNDMCLILRTTEKPESRNSAFTLVEVVMAIAILALIYGIVIKAYTQAIRRAEWTGYSLAAQALAIQQIEQVRSARWDPNLYQQGIPDEITNITLLNRTFTSGANWKLTGYTWTTLDLPTSGTNYTYATNWVTIQYVVNGLAAVTSIQVDTVWPFTRGTNRVYYTNSVGTYLAPDNRDSSTIWGGT